MTPHTLAASGPGSRRFAARSEKIQRGHQDRLAVVYVRQSTAPQVLDHQESTRLQYGLVTQAAALGWPQDRILVIDDDQGKSGSSAEGRAGFQRLVSEVSLDHVGLILGVEMSRLARSNKDWHQLLELCALFRTLIADLDGIYDPGQYNDRLLLGLKGTMSEAELHILKQRMYEGRLGKARRGELTFALPTGYVWQAPGVIGFDPDAQVQAVIRFIFQLFAEVGTLGGVLRYLARNGVEIGVRVREGPGKGALIWRRPNRQMLQNLLRHPIYAGAYVYGRRQVDSRRQRPGRPQTGRVVMAPGDWLAFVPDHCPAYISWDHFEQNCARLAANRAHAEAVGAPRTGAALLAGLVDCGHCGYRLSVHYQGTPIRHTYECSQLRNNYGGRLCQHVPGGALDCFVSAHVLRALAPDALELSLAATERIEEERAALDRLWQQRRERAAYETERARRQYASVEPEHRLVARTLEHAWEEQLAAQERLEEEYHRFAHQQPRLLTVQERAAIRQLAADIPALWAAATTTEVDRKEILRQVVARVVVTAQGASERVVVHITWVGGATTTGEIIRPIRRLTDLSTYPQLCARVRELSAAGYAARDIADSLNTEGYRPPRVGGRFGKESVFALQRQVGVYHHRSRARPAGALHADEWFAPDLARALLLPRATLHSWIQRGWVQARQETAWPLRWIVWADTLELDRLRQLRQGAGIPAPLPRVAGQERI